MGINAVTVTVEMDISVGVGLHLVGLPDSAVRESLLRVTTALNSYGFSVPGKKIVVNLAPADIRKEGSSYDLAIAVGLLAVSGQVKMPFIQDYLIVGELALDGSVRPVPGALPIAVHAKEAGFKGCIFPRPSALETVDLDGIEIYGVEKMSEVIEILCGRKDMRELLVTAEYPVAPSGPMYSNDFKDVKGQAIAKRGLEIAAAGGHSVLLSGSPGSGKSLMASCLPSILPPMTREESIETSKIYSIAGYGSSRGLMRERPFRTPHHSSSLVSIIGGGANASPGEISLAHNGVLYLDEVAQFGKTLLDSLRQPIEDGRVVISRARYKVEYPCSFMLVASMNPCPCGYYGDGSGRCHCSRNAVDRYQERLSGPFLDRMDLHINCFQIDSSELVNDSQAESSAEIAKRVAAARRVQEERFRNEGIFTNSQMNAAQIRKYCRTGSAEKELLRGVIDKMGFSARAYDRILKLARTIADLEGNNLLTLQSISEAVQFRTLDRRKTND